MVLDITRFQLRREIIAFSNRTLRKSGEGLEIFTTLLHYCYWSTIWKPGSKNNSLTAYMNRFQLANIVKLLV